MKDQTKTRLVFLLNVAQRAVDRWIENRAGGPALSPAQAGTMFLLSRSDGALIGDVAQALNIGAPAMSGLANRLEQAGYLVRKRDAEDGRAIRLYQTDEGRAAGQRAKAALSALNTQLSEGFSQEEMSVVGRWLETLPRRLSVENLQTPKKGQLAPKRGRSWSWAPTQGFISYAPARLRACRQTVSNRARSALGRRMQFIAADCCASVADGLPCSTRAEPEKSRTSTSKT